MVNMVEMGARAGDLVMLSGCQGRGTVGRVENMVRMTLFVCVQIRLLLHPCPDHALRLC